MSTNPVWTADRAWVYRDGDPLFECPDDDTAAWVAEACATAVEMDEAQAAWEASGEAPQCSVIEVDGEGVRVNARLETGEIRAAFAEVIRATRRAAAATQADYALAPPPADSEKPGTLPAEFAALPFERRIRFAISDPGAFTPRADGFTESLPNWAMRAVMIALRAHAAEIDPADLRAAVASVLRSARVVRMSDEQIASAVRASVLDPLLIRTSDAVDVVLAAKDAEITELRERAEKAERERDLLARRCAVRFEEGQGLGARAARAEASLRDLVQHVTLYRLVLALIPHGETITPKEAVERLATHGITASNTVTSNALGHHVRAKRLIREERGIYRRPLASSPDRGTESETS